MARYQEPSEAPEARPSRWHATSGSVTCRDHELHAAGPGAVFTGGRSLSLMRPSAKQKSDTMSVGHHPTPPRKSTKPRLEAPMPSTIDLFTAKIFATAALLMMNQFPVGHLGRAGWQRSRS
jgi:hypothetical protein